jgi:hypothetical protein
MLDTFASVGVQYFDLTHTNIEGEKRGFRPKQTLEQIRRSIPYLVVFERGDVALYYRLDMFGRAAIAGHHPNYGFSGYFKASVFDGKKWRAFKIFDFVLEKDRHFSNHGDRASVYQRLAALIQTRAGCTLRWGNRAYEMLGPDPVVDTKLTNPSG